MHLDLCCSARPSTYNAVCLLQECVDLLKGQGGLARCARLVRLQELTERGCQLRHDYDVPPSFSTAHIPLENA